VSDTTNGGVTRRDMLKTAGGVAAAAALTGALAPHLHAGESNTIQVALVGCGGRGTGAAGDALSSKSGPTKLVAMADAFDDRLKDSHRRLKESHEKQLDVPEDRRFVGFDAYKKAIDCLKKGDVVIFATPPAFRWVHFTYAIQKGINVFMEKPVTVDGPSTRRMLKLGEESEKLGLKVGVGLMCRHCVARGELYKRIKDGQIGDLMLLRAYRQQGKIGSAFTRARKPDDPMSELEYQIRNFHSFLWASGGAYSDFLIHNIDECCWMKDAWPVEAKGSGGRHFRGDYVDQNFDHYSVEYTFADGAKLLLEGRNIDNCQQEFASYAHGTKGSARISTSGHVPAEVAIYNHQRVPSKGQKGGKIEPAWAFPPDKEPNPYQVEWDHLLAAIREDKPYNEVKRGAEASLVTAMGRMACHTGRPVTFEQALNHADKYELGQNVDQLTMESPPPASARADKNGKYGIPQPGITRQHELPVNDRG
jgi:predicted dehydrogenase